MWAYSAHDLFKLNPNNTPPSWPCGVGIAGVVHFAFGDDSWRLEPHSTGWRVSRLNAIRHPVPHHRAQGQSRAVWSHTAPLYRRAAHLPTRQLLSTVNSELNEASKFLPANWLAKLKFPI